MQLYFEYLIHHFKETNFSNNYKYGSFYSLFEVKIYFKIFKYLT